jgi:hypothetical protein
MSIIIDDASFEQEWLSQNVIVTVRGNGSLPSLYLDWLIENVGAEKKRVDEDYCWKTGHGWRMLWNMYDFDHEEWMQPIEFISSYYATLFLLRWT